MPVIINEIEVLEQPAPPAAGPNRPPPATAPPAADKILRLLRDADGRQRRLVAD